MKKYIWLLCSTAVIIELLFLVRSWTQTTPVAVQLVTLEAGDPTRTVECAGKVQLADSRDVFVEVPCVAGDVYVSAGQKVKKGDVLFAVDVNATQAVLSQLGSSVSGSVQPKKQVVAPADGVIAEMSVKKGAVLDHTKPCAVIAPGAGKQIAVVVREKYLQQIKVGQPVRVTGVGFSRKEYAGRVTGISSTARQQYVGTVTETVVDATVVLDDNEADESLRVGLNATAAIVVDTVKNALLVPYSCIGQDEEGQEYVYVYGNDNVARRRTLEVSREYSDGVLVVSGLSAGDRLVRNPEKLSGDSVLVREAG